MRHKMGLLAGVKSRRVLERDKGDRGGARGVRTMRAELTLAMGR